MKPRYLWAAALLAGMPLLAGCYFDSEERLYGPVPPCNSPTVTYLAAVGPILSTHCLACHGTGTFAKLGANINLGTYAGVKAAADNGGLLKSIRHESGVSAMPKNAPQLSSCDVEVMRRWVEGGALND